MRCLGLRSVFHDAEHHSVPYVPFSRLTSLVHPNLCEYIHLETGNDRLLIVSEHWSTSLEAVKADIKDKWREVLFDIMSGVAYLHEHGIRQCNVTLKTVVLDDQV